MNKLTQAIVNEDRLRMLAVPSDTKEACQHPKDKTVVKETLLVIRSNAFRQLQLQVHCHPVNTVLSLRA